MLLTMSESLQHDLLYFLHHSDYMKWGRAKEIEENPKLADIKQPKKLDDAYVTWILGIFGAHHFYLGNDEQHRELD